MSIESHFDGFEQRLELRLRTALNHAEDPEARFHIRQALQMLAGEPSEASSEPTV